MKTSPAQKAFLTGLILELEQAGCAPILLRNHETFPDEIGNDLDIFVPAESLDAAWLILRSRAAEQGGEIGHLHRRGYFVAVWLRFPDSTAPIHIDLYPGALTWHGLRFLDDAELVHASRPAETGTPATIPARAHEALVSLLASILWGGFFKARYQDPIHELISAPEERERFTRLLERNFGEEGTLLADAVARKEATALVTRGFSARLRSRLTSHNLRTRPMASLRGWLRHWMEEIACYLTRRPGTVVEYRKGVFSPGQLDEVRDRLGAYHGDTRELRHAEPRWKKLGVSWRLRGKNHLVLLESDRFAINGSLCTVAPEAGPEALIAEALQTLRDRLHLQFS